MGVLTLVIIGLLAGVFFGRFWGSQNLVLCLEGKEAGRSQLGNSRLYQLVLGIRSRSANQASADASLGIRQSPRGDIVPPALTLGPLGKADLLN